MTDLSNVRLVALDVDGTLTEGGLIYGPQGVSQVFNSKDGAGIMRLVSAGIRVAFVSFRDFECTRRRASDLGVELLCLGSTDKATSVTALADHLDIPLSSVLFMGDDRMDIPAMTVSGISACPSDAAQEVRKVCDIVSSVPGGRGAVREIADALLEASRE